MEMNDLEEEIDSKYLIKKSYVPVAQPKPI